MILTDLDSQASHNPVPGLTIDSAGNAVSLSHRDFGNLREQLSLFWGQVHVDREHLDSQGACERGNWQCRWHGLEGRYRNSRCERSAQESPSCIYSYAELLVTELLKVLNLSTHIE
ncbi:hypothetical protein E4U19_007175 [Claviceps sp. Clav32 group G5]|nr:hypothetical protein E4U19_007175 [Claviceps sp. Clav32 group G5]